MCIRDSLEDDRNPRGATEGIHQSSAGGVTELGLGVGDRGSKRRRGRPDVGPEPVLRSGCLLYTSRCV